MAHRRKTWREKLADDKDLPKTVRPGGKAAEKWGEGTMLIPAPREVDALMKKVPCGKLVTINELRQKLQKQHKADVTCPITTGIFAWIAAGAADEEAREGTPDDEITPYWRTLKGRSKGRWVVENFEAALS